MQSCDGGAEAQEGVADVVTDALERELNDLQGVKDSTLAASALVLAAMLDDPETADTARTAAARELREALAVLRALSAPAEEDRMTVFEQRARGRAA